MVKTATTKGQNGDINKFLKYGGTDKLKSYIIILLDLRAQCVRTRMYVCACECRPMCGRVCVRECARVGVLMDVYVCALVYACACVRAHAWVVPHMCLPIKACACACGRSCKCVCGCGLTYVRVCVRTSAYACMIILSYHYIFGCSLWVRVCVRVCIGLVYVRM